MGSYHWNEKSKRYFISIYWQGKQYTIWRYTGRPIRAEKDAIEALFLINAEVKNGDFNPKAWHNEHGEGKIGQGGGDRTLDLWFPKPALYLTELHPDDTIFTK